jgi:hypothetical protein
VRRAVIVYEQAGQGHRAAAEVLASILSADPDVEVVLADGAELERGRAGQNPLVTLWNFLITRGWYRLADLIINHWFRVAILPLLAVSAALPRVKARLKALRPDAVVSTADAYNRALGDAADDLGVPFTVLPIEFSVFADVMHPRASYLVYFEETARAIRRFDLTTPYFRVVIRDDATARERLAYLFQWFTTYSLRRTEPLLFQPAGGVAAEANTLPCHVLGPLRAPADHAAAAIPVPAGRPQVLVASGSLGGRFVSRAVRQLLAAPDVDVDIVAVCGRDEALLAELRQLTPVSAAARLDCCGYVEDMPARLRRASVLLVRPSASLFLESVLAGVPMLIPAKATKNDSGTVDLIRAWRIGETYDDDDDIPAVLGRMLPNLGEYRARLAALRARYPEPREQVAARIRSVVWRTPSP